MRAPGTEMRLPYHRRFLDGYYPYHLKLKLSYPGRKLRLDRLQPSAQAGFEVTSTSGSLGIESWFEGELTISLEFSRQ